jgi:hypothetical protein
MKRALPWIVLALVGIFAVREFFPKHVRIVEPPRIITVHDTVQHLDTAWVVRLLKRTDTLYQERVTITKPDTVYVAPRVWGLTALQVATKVGDSSLARGFSIAPSASGGIVHAGWQVQFWTPGPLLGLTIEAGQVRSYWGSPPPKPCAFWCQRKHEAFGLAAGWAIGRLGKP